MKMSLDQIGCVVSLSDEDMFPREPHLAAQKDFILISVLLTFLIGGLATCHHVGLIEEIKIFTLEKIQVTPEFY